MLSIYEAKSIFITENGCAADDFVADDGRIYDTDRVIFMRGMLSQLQRATAEGVGGGRVFLLELPGQPGVERRVRQPLH